VSTVRRLVSLLRSRHVVPPLTAVLLALPCIRFSYLYDDYDFLHRASAFRIGDLAPDPHSLFYRPLSRELWFGTLGLLHLDAPVVLHLLNALLLAIGVALLMILTRRLLGERAAMIAGFSLAGLGSASVLVGWASGVQDLMAMDFLLCATLLQLAGRRMSVVAALAAAVLAKEAVVGIVPFFPALAWAAEGRKPKVSDALPFLGILLVWAFIHPGVHALIQRRFEGGEGSYLGWSQAQIIPSLIRSLLTLLNIPIAAVDGTAIGLRWVVLILACALVTVALYNDKKASGDAHSTRGVLVLAGILALPPLLLTISLARYWAPYYTCLSAVGTSLAAAAVLRGAPGRIVCGILIGFMALGILTRAEKLAPSVTTEANLERTSRALDQVEAGFKKLYPSLAPASVAYVSSQVHGVEAIYAHVYRFQVLRVWYREPSLVTAKPQSRRPGTGREYLFWILPNLDVGEIDPTTLRARSSGARPDYGSYQKTLRSYAFGLGWSGEPVQAARVLLAMPEPNEIVGGVDARIAATFLIMAGRSALADSVLAHAPSIDRDGALSALSGVLAEAPTGVAMDGPAFVAFGVDTSDVDAIRGVMLWTAQHGYAATALRLAQRLLRIEPEDSQARALAAELNKPRRTDRIVPESSADSP
jgi:hypothetical protein